ncbi:TIGR03083 family protein [Streptoalloteichus tenebrarius]|uniref:TIGR03083 family protein n=1 Tax=Streptoalloteichus tenebrarius (strain ATCC 17920 / DSM 40477 / JCM 4838 / CBS 697.72 / NBRC 16177 / NCIMB 11028 / NRRL B-12390 / A12253. 1 / ISP 5477) TaxID=1933 RepID=A0ABT1HU74_STRSD|nr:maleylpyruvate isomerase N-terminal domain-containing protein [Streptoalloteichus tenebrarius]MCP2259078.1 TIGR03083 family protein [Streptoalloteichus tenebrarius]BFE99596.1 maleylpyruvate isomerase N-terminal domain-containing protein [Streptoalloteichus tenebrarius]
MTTEAVTRRHAYAEAGRAFRDLVSQVGPDGWRRRALGEWTVLDLVGHTSRALATVETALSRPATRVELADPVAYYRAASAIDQGEVAERGRDAGRALGGDPAGAVAELCDRVLVLVARTPDDTGVTTRLGGMRLIDYLPTRTFELAVHTRDLATALALPAPDTPLALHESLRLAADLAFAAGRGEQALLALTGRHPLPPGFSVL